MLLLLMLLLLMLLLLILTEYRSIALLCGQRRRSFGLGEDLDLPIGLGLLDRAEKHALLRFLQTR